MGFGDDRWTKSWKLNEDPIGILGGVKNREFQLEPIDADQGRKFAFIYTPEDPSNDPFVNTVFAEWGVSFPTEPVTKLKQWKRTEEIKYRQTINRYFREPNLNVLRLLGTKVVNGATEWLSLFLLPRATEYFSSYRDLIVVSCRTRLVTEIQSIRGRLILSHLHQDGTAHGNPR